MEREARDVGRSRLATAWGMESGQSRLIVGKKRRRAPRGDARQRHASYQSRGPAPQPRGRARERSTYLWRIERSHVKRRGRRGRREETLRKNSLRALRSTL